VKVSITTQSCIEFQLSLSEPAKLFLIKHLNFQPAVAVRARLTFSSY